MGYRLLRLLVRQILSIFFSSIRVVGEPPVEHGPVVVVANHPNFMFDPLLLGLSYERYLWYLGKSTLFHNPVAAWILGSLGVLPVYRRHESATASDNRKTFSKVSNKLLQGEGIAVFPEGVSMGERRMFPVKTGTARMAFQAYEEGADEQIAIQPVGIVYTDMDEFQSSVTIVVGTPISVRDHYCKGCTEEQKRQSVRDLTAKLEEDLKELSVHVVDPHEAELIEKVAKCYATAGFADDDYQRLSAVAHEIEVKEHLPTDRLRDIERRLDEYLSQLSRWGLGGGKSLEERVSTLMWWIVLLPVTVGAVFHAIPYHLTGPLANGLSGHKVYISTLKVSLGAFLFLLWYVLTGVVLLREGFSGFEIVAWITGLITCGVLANKWLVTVLLGLYRFLPDWCGPFPQALEKRDELLADFESLRGTL